jgi:psp operon transcriptional activator
MPERPSQTIIGEAPAFLEMLEHVSRAATLSKPVLVVGERGTGKELIAARLHFLSPRWERPLIKVNCAALTESILESELFGHEAGAFTGASKSHIGHFERADGGTLVLDELATISLRMQEKILRVIENCNASAAAIPFSLTCELSVRPMQICANSSRRAGSARTCSTGWPST